MKTRHQSLRRALLASLALAAFAGPGIASGCGGGFAPVSQVSGLRVLAVAALNDKSYASPGDEVFLQMTYDDPRGRPLQIVWLGGCFDPPGDNYFGCYAQLAPLLQGFDPAHLAGSGLVGLGDVFPLTIPEDIVTRRPRPADGTPYYGIAYVFFAACAGQLGPVPPEGSGMAASFPIGCFDASGNRLGADSFVPGYTEVYAFADGRTNGNPAVNGLDMAPASIVDDAGHVPDGGLLTDMTSIAPCSIAEDARLGPAGCGRPDPFKQCTEYELSVDVPDDVAEIDPSGQSQDGKPLRETVWVDYFADRGDIDTATVLVSDATTGIQTKTGVNWIAPPDPGAVNFWAVVHDSRGGATVVQRTLQVCLATGTTCATNAGCCSGFCNGGTCQAKDGG